MTVKKELVDIQSVADTRNIPIDKVGVRYVKYPMQLRDCERGVQHTIGDFSLTVDLPHDHKGTHGVLMHTLRRGPDAFFGQCCVDRSNAIQVNGHNISSAI